MSKASKFPVMSCLALGEPRTRLLAVWYADITLPDAVAGDLSLNSQYPDDPDVSCDFLFFQ